MIVYDYSSLGEMRDLEIRLSIFHSNYKQFLEAANGYSPG